jgi:hypothetical protein
MCICMLRSCMEVLIRLAKTIYILCIYGIFGRNLHKYMAVYGVYVWFWPTLRVLCTKPCTGRNSRKGFNPQVGLYSALDLQFNKLLLKDIFAGFSPVLSTKHPHQAPVLLS